MQNNNPYKPNNIHFRAFSGLFRLADDTFIEPNGERPSRVTKTAKFRVSAMHIIAAVS